MPAKYNTKQKTYIFEAVKDFEERHFTVDELIFALSQKDINVGRSTVYRALEEMSQDGILIKYKLDEKEVACYQYAPCRSEGHFHLKCVVCNKLYHAECDHLKDLTSHIVEHHGFIIDNSKTVFYGICEECSGEKK